MQHDEIRCLRSELTNVMRYEAIAGGDIAMPWAVIGGPAVAAA